MLIPSSRVKLSLAVLALWLGLLALVSVQVAPTEAASSQQASAYGADYGKNDKGGQDIVVTESPTNMEERLDKAGYAADALLNATAATAISRLEDDHVFYYDGHGNWCVISFEEPNDGGESLIVGPGFTSGDDRLGVEGLDLSDLECAVFKTCLAGKDSDKEGNIMKAFMDQGAWSAIGFSCTIEVGWSVKWADLFGKYALDEGKEVGEAARKALQDVTSGDLRFIARDVALRDPIMDHLVVLRAAGKDSIHLSADTGGGTETPSPTSTGRSDTVLVMDVSGSMNDSLGDETKMDAAKAAAGSIVSMVRDASTAQGGSSPVGLAWFTTTATLSQPLSSNYDLVTAAVSEMVPLDNTNLGDGLEKGLGGLYGTSADDERMIVLLSDGLSNEGMSNEDILSGPVARAAAEGIKIYTVGFGDSGELDEDLLREIATRTGGAYYFADEAFNLQNVYIKLRHEAGGEVLGDFTGDAYGEQQAGTFAVDPTTGELHGTLNTEGGFSQITLEDPDGLAVDGEYPGAAIFADSDPAYVIIKNPKPGTWTALVDAGSGGQASYDVIVSAHGARSEGGDYSLVLAVVAGAAVVLALVLIAIFRWPLTLAKRKKDAS